MVMAANLLRSYVLHGSSVASCNTKKNIRWLVSFQNVKSTHLGQVDGHLAPMHHGCGHHVVDHGLTLVTLLPIPHIPSNGWWIDPQHDFSQPFLGLMEADFFTVQECTEAASPYHARMFLISAPTELMLIG
jgi:hypothetical protein